MKLVELKCKNCGAQLKVEEGTSQVKCEFCGSTFSVDDAYNEGYKYTKGVLKARSEQMEEDFNKAQDLIDDFIGKPSKVFSIAFVAIFILIFAFIGYHMYVGFSDSRNSRDSFEIDSFNTPYETDAGKRSGFFIVGTLDDIVTNNKTNKSHIITVVYNDITTTEEKEIKEIRNKLSDRKDYDVSLDYDSNGYVNKYTIEDIEVSKKEIERDANLDIQIPNVDNITDEDYVTIKDQLEEKIDSMKSMFENY